ncbi:14024_t:CDS:1, partial [Dentiscutata erythropus]
MTETKTDTFRRFMFTIFNNLEEFNELIQEIYSESKIQKIKYQFEANYNIDELKVLINEGRYDPNRDVKIINKHIQGFCILTKQERIGRYIKKNEKYKTKKGGDKIAQKESASGIKGLFKNNLIHIDYNNGTIEDALNYTGKEFNRCFLHHNSKNTPCKCNLFDRYDHSACNYCDENCWQYRLFARCNDIENPGPYEF